jgi:hypothetical protein
MCFVGQQMIEVLAPYSNYAMLDIVAPGGDFSKYCTTMNTMKIILPEYY